MKTEFRNRAFLPVVMPLAIILSVAALVAMFALILLYNTHEAALVIAAVAAAGILVAIALAASQDELSGGQKAAVFAAGVLPIAVGAIFSIVSVTGGVDQSLLNINREPHLQVAEDAIVGAQNLQSFCLPTEDGGCEDTREWSVSAQDAEQFLFLFDNMDGGTPHNVALFTLADEATTGEDVAPDSAGEELFIGDVITGPAEVTYQAPTLEPGKYFFHCSVHPQDMIGVLTYGEGGEGGEGGGATEGEDGGATEGEDA